MKATRKTISKLDRAAERIAEIVVGHISTLPVEEAEAMREEIRKLAAQGPALKNRKKGSN